MMVIMALITVSLSYYIGTDWGLIIIEVIVNGKSNVTDNDGDYCHDQNHTGNLRRKKSLIFTRKRYEKRVTSYLRLPGNPPIFPTQHYRYLDQSNPQNVMIKYKKGKKAKKSRGKKESSEKFQTKLETQTIRNNSNYYVVFSTIKIWYDNSCILDSGRMILKEETTHFLCA